MWSLPAEQYSPQFRHLLVALPWPPRWLGTAVLPISPNNSEWPIPNPKVQGGDPLIHWDANTWRLSWEALSQCPDCVWSSTRISLASTAQPPTLAKALSPSEKWHSTSLWPEIWSEDWVVQAKTTLQWALVPVMNWLEGRPMLPFRSEPSWVPWAKIQPSSTHLWVPTLENDSS